MKKIAIAIIVALSCIALFGCPAPQQVTKKPRISADEESKIVRTAGGTPCFDDPDCPEGQVCRIKVELRYAGVCQAK